MKSNLSLFYQEVKLVPYSNEHDQQTVLWLNDSKVKKDFGLTKKITLDSHRKWVESKDNLQMWAIYNKYNVYIGNVSLMINQAHYSGYFQIYIGDQKNRGEGYGWKVLLSILFYAFNIINLHRVWLHVLPENETAIYLYKKAGFTQEGIERDSLYNDGLFYDQFVFSILKNEWESLRKGFISI